MKKFILTVFTICLILGVGVALIYRGYDNFLDTPADPNDSERLITEIDPGASTSNVIEKLSEAKLITNKTYFKYFITLEGYDTEIKAGKYVLTRNLTPIEIIEKLTNPAETELAITIPEGYKVTDIDNLLAESNLIERGDFIDCVKNCEFPDYDFLDQSKLPELYPLEGFLYPDTYFVNGSTFSIQSFIQRLLDNFDNKLNAKMIADINNQNKDMQEIIIMASIIEREVHTNDDLPIVSGILWKRYENDWMIGADATLLYEKDNNEINYEDLQSQSPYNTRKNKGLPPGPICNPGIKSIKAAIYPEESEYWFYLTTLDTGEVIYAVSNEEHEENKTNYL